VEDYLKVYETNINLKVIISSLWRQPACEVLVWFNEFSHDYGTMVTINQSVNQSINQ